MSAIENLSGKNIEIQTSFSGNYLGVLEVGKLVANYGLAQVVYEIILEGEKAVIKILRPGNQKDFYFGGEEREFSEVDFYGTCMETLRKLSIVLPEISEVIRIQRDGETKPELGFLQSYLKGPIIEDRKTVSLPDIGLIIGESPRGTMRPLNFQEGFFLPEEDTVIFADWDKYLHQLKLAAEKIGVTTKADLENFKNKLISSM